ncbi:MAG: hypothetical protein KAS23_04795, partial [Anaerohalosphaera sp.]|nr:hypothetical protein [Anaerohalosphaera sp.]
MNHKALKTDGSSQMRSVAVLLIVAVVLPTVCLLWFMGRAIKNERLAIQQRLIDFYSGQADEKFVEFSRTYWNQFRDKAVEVDDTGPDDWFAELADGGKLSVFDGVLVYDEGGNLLYPVVSDRQQADHEYEYTEAEQLEFIDNDIAGAIEAYDKAAMSDEGLWTKAMAGKARCLKKAGKLADAGAVYKELAWPAKTRPDSDEYAAQSQIMLARIYQSIAHRDFYSTCEKIADERFSTLKIDTADRIFLLEELLEITAETGIAKQMSDSINEVENVIAHDKLSVSTVELLDGGRFEDWPDWTFRRLGDEPRLYGFRYQISNKIIVPLFTEDNAKDFWQAAVKAIEDEMVFCRVLDDRGDIVAGTPKYYAGGELIFGRQFMSLDLDPFFPGWKVDLYFFAGTFNEATKRQKIIYIWTAALVILVMLIVSGLAGKVMVKQARINRLKNDFVA